MKRRGPDFVVDAHQFHSTMNNSKSIIEKKLPACRSVYKGFKSPIATKPESSGTSIKNTQLLSEENKTRPSHDLVDIKVLQREVDDLKEQLQEVEEQIKLLKEEGLEESELAEHITKLHEYNDIKDIAQMILGHIASLEGVRTKDIYPRYGLELDD